MPEIIQIKPKILIFILTYPPFIGGAEIAVQEITKRLDNDFNFDLITARLDKKLLTEERINNVNVYRVGWGKNLDKYLYPWLAMKKAKELWFLRGHGRTMSPAWGRTMSPAMNLPYAIAWGVVETWGGWAALKFKEKFPQVKYLLTMQSGDSDAFIKARTWFWFWRYKKIFTKADRIQAISTFLAKRAVKYG